VQHERAHGGSVAVQRGRTATAPLGYSIPAFPWYIDQTIGGAVATGSHGSTLRFGSVSSQARLPKPFPYNFLTWCNLIWKSACAGCAVAEQRTCKVQLRKLRRECLQQIVSSHMAQGTRLDQPHAPHHTIHTQLCTFTVYTAGKTVTRC